MNPLQIILHVGAIISAVKDLEATIGDVVSKNGNFKGDIKKVLEDLKGIVDSGLISIPNLTTAQIDEAIASRNGDLMDYLPPHKRFDQTHQGDPIASEYDISSDDLNDAVIRNVFPFKVLTIDLSVAQTTPLELVIPGRAITMFDYLASDATKAPIGTALVNMTLNDNQDDAFPLRYKRGYNGTYTRVFLTWPALAGAKADIIFLRSTRMPWMLG